MHHFRPQPFPDDYGLGQSVVARIQRDVSAKDCLRNARDVLSTSYVPDDWLAMRSRLMKKSAATYHQAKAILEQENGQ